MIPETLTQRKEVAFVDLQAQWREISQEIHPALTRVLESANFILSDEVSQFEKEFASFLGAAHCVGVGSGTDALMLALEALGVGAGDEVLVPTNTYVATVAAIRHRRAVPVYVDMNDADFLMDLQDAQSKCGAKTKAIIPVHLYGQAMDLGELLAWARAKRLAVIEDACQAHGAALEGRKAGTWGDAGCFSFYPGKNLGCYGDGGAIVFADGAKARVAAELRNQGQSEKYVHPRVGYNSRLDSLQAAILRVKLRHLPRWNALRRQWASSYDELLKDIPGLCLPQWDKENPQGHVFHLYVLRCARRDALLRLLRERGVMAQIHYPIPVHGQEGFRDAAFGPNSLPRAEQAAGEILSLPLYPELTREKVEHVASCVREFFRV